MPGTSDACRAWPPMTSRFSHSTRVAAVLAATLCGIAWPSAQGTRLRNRRSPCPRASRSNSSPARRWSIGRSPPTSTSRAGSTSPTRPARTTRSRSSSQRSRTASCGWKTPTATASSTSSVVFADKMMFPEGTMWLDGSLYVARAAQHLEADRHRRRRRRRPARGVVRRARRSPAAPTICTARTSGRDGWIYWCKGAFAEQTYERPGKPPFVTRAAHIFRAPARTARASSR